MAPISKILFLLTPSQRRAALMLMGLMVVGMLLEALGVGLVIPAIALMTQPDLGATYPGLQKISANFGPVNQVQLVQAAMIGLVAIYLLKNAFLAFLYWRQAKFTNGVQAQLSQRLFALYLGQPYVFHLQRNSAQLIRNISTEVAMFAVAIANGLMVLAESLVLLGIASLLLVVEPLGAMLVFVTLGSAAWLFYCIIRKRIVDWGVARQYHDGMRIQHLQQGLAGVKDAKLLGREEEFLKQYGVHTLQSAQANRRRATVSHLPRLWLEWLAVVGLAALVLFMLSTTGHIENILPTVGLFAAAAFRLMPSVNRILASIQAVRYSLPAVFTLNEEVRTAAAASAEVHGEGDRVRGELNFLHEIQLRDVGYTYPGAASAALSVINLRIPKGESIGLIGTSGSGKSTLVDLILGLLTPDYGEIRVDDKDINESLRSWQNKIGYVPQTIYLTDDTLARNVAFGLPDDQIDEKAVWRALDAAQLKEFAESLPQGLTNKVGERGVRLSGGQRQRIGIARALYHNPEVLVLDEATSSLDATTERGIMQAVNALRGDKTVLIVAHRLSTVAQCDCLYKLDGGRVVAEGAPEQVLSLARAV